MENTIETWYENNQDRLDEMYEEYVSFGEWGSGYDRLDTSYGSDIHEEWIEDQYYTELEESKLSFRKFVEGYKKFYFNGGFVIDLGLVVAFIVWISK